MLILFLIAIYAYGLVCIGILVHKIVSFDWSDFWYKMDHPQIPIPLSAPEKKYTSGGPLYDNCPLTRKEKDAHMDKLIADCSKKE